MKQVRYTQGRMAERSKATDSRNSPLRLLGHECVRGFESHSCQNLRSKRLHFNQSRIESHSCQILRSKSQQFGRSSISESNQEQDEADFTLQEGVIEDRMKQVRYTQSRMDERSKAKDSRKSPSRLLIHECVRGFESHSCQILSSKRQQFNRSSVESNSCRILRSKNNILVEAVFLRVKSRARRSRFHITRRCYRSKCDILKPGWPRSLRRQNQE